MASARDGDFDPERWWEKAKSIKFFTRELAGMAEAIWELRDVNRSTNGAATYRTHNKRNRKSYAQSGHNPWCKIVALALYTD